MRDVIVGLAAVMGALVAGCTSAGHPEAARGSAGAVDAAVRVGMPIKTARMILRENGAREVRLATAPPQYQAILDVELPGDRLLSVVYDPQAGGAVTALYLCTNPEKHRGDREWLAVESVEVAKQEAPGK